MPKPPFLPSLPNRLATLHQTDNAYAGLLITLVVFIVVNPLLPAVWLGRLLLNLLYSLIVAAGIYSAWKHQVKLRWFVLLTGLGSLLSQWPQVWQPETLSGLVALRGGMTLAFLSYITVRLIIRIAKNQRVTANVIYGAISGYLLVGLTGAMLASTLEILLPGSFSLGLEQSSNTEIFQHLLYFCFITLSTIGYGDITPETPIAQSFAITLGLFGQMYLTVLVAILVGKFLNQRSS